MSVPETRPSLLLRLRDPKDREAWEAFVLMYQHVVHRMAVRRGMQAADADDLTQHVLWSISRAIDRFDPSDQTARFRNWLRKIAHHAIINALTRESGARGLGGPTSDLRFDELVAPHVSAPDLELDYRREVFLVAAAQVREEVDDATWACFWETTIHGRSVDEVAKELRRTHGSIYSARCRVIKRLRDKVQRLDDQGAPS